MGVETSQLWIVLKTQEWWEPITFEVECLQHWEQLHAFDFREAFEMEIKALIKLKCSIVSFPILAEEL